MRAPLLVLALCAFAAPSVIAAGGFIQPGDPYNDICTLNFVFTDASRTYIGTAAHCVERLGESASTDAAADFGSVVWLGDVYEEMNGIAGVQLDFALIQVKPAFVALVKPDVAGHAGWPTGSSTAATTATGDVIHVSGWGFGTHPTAITRESRVGVLVSDDAREYAADTMAIPGDSGGPLTLDDGRALGVVSIFNLGALPPTTDYGPTLEGILAELHAHGFPVSLKTA